MSADGRRQETGGIGVAGTAGRTGAAGNADGKGIADEADGKGIADEAGSKGIADEAGSTSTAGEAGSTTAAGVAGGVGAAGEAGGMSAGENGGGAGGVVGGDEVVLRLTDVVKTFPGVRALDGVQLEVRAGEVHCLLGQNGAGKSTLIKVLAGVHHADAGEISWLGEPFAPASPQAAMRAGIATIYQELDLVDDLSVADNAFLGREESRLGFTRRRSTAARTKAILSRLGHAEIPPGRLVRTLPAAGKQIVSMARALSHDARLIVMDEPSAVLAHDEVGNLFRIIREMTAQGIAVIYISHRLAEIREIGDRVTVLKDGRTTAAGLPARSTSTRELVGRMTGRNIEYVFPPRPEASDAEPILTVKSLTRANEFSDVDLTVAPGEIVGIAGLVGSGRSELLETIYGARRPDAGTITLDGRRIRSTKGAVRSGMGMAPEERKSQALLLDQPVYKNMTLASFTDFGRAGFTDAGGERKAAQVTADRLDLRPRDVGRAVRTLSGGNQQKVVVGRWLLKDQKILLLDEPTRGVDVGARAELYQVIRALAEDGVGVLLVSSEVPEVLGLADRVLVMREGRIVHRAPATELDEDTVLDLVMAGSLLQSEGEPA